MDPYPRGPVSSSESTRPDAARLWAPPVVVIGDASSGTSRGPAGRVAR